MKNGNANNHLGTGFFIHKGMILAVKWVQCIQDRMSYKTIRGRWRDIIILNVHAPTEDKSHDTKATFNEELQPVFDQLPKHYLTIF